MVKGGSIKNGNPETDFIVQSMTNMRIKEFSIKVFSDFETSS